MKQERDFKLKVYPSLGFSFVIPFIFMFNMMRSDHVDYSTSISYLNIYFSMLIIPSAVMMLGHSAKYKAAWIYKVFPIKDYTDLQKGSLKAFLIKLYIPLYLFEYWILLYLLPRIIPDLLIVLVASCLYTIICYMGFENKVPFTKPFDEIGDGQSWKALILFIPLGILAFIHYLLATSIFFLWYFYLFLCTGHCQFHFLQIVVKRKERPNRCQTNRRKQRKKRNYRVNKN
ncbi:ABC transporter permease OS=Lysinibacillus sphaericus OX=1421 GN=LS41612_12845 PE=4 SV=1 [Lysinibacillus sphaericus]